MKQHRRRCVRLVWALGVVLFVALVINLSTSANSQHAQTNGAQASATSATTVVVGPDLIWSQTYSATNAPQVSALAFAPDRQTILTGHANRTVNLWRASDGALIRSIPGGGYTCGGISAAGYTPDSQLFTATDSCNTRFFTVADGTLVRTIGAIARVAISPDGQYLASTFAVHYSSRTVKLWRVSDGSLVWSVTGGGNNVAFAPDGTLASIGRDGIEFWQLADGAKLRKLGTLRYRFARWSSYAAFLGTQPDYRNEFSHSWRIPFTAGVLVSDEDLKHKPIYLVVTGEGCHQRMYDRFGQPPVFYQPGDCKSLKPNLTIEDFKGGGLAVLKRFE